jgi:poly(3-hydroxybutyrate) depolymerase
MTRLRLLAIAIAIAIVLGAWPVSADEKITKEKLTSGGAERTYYLMVPDAAREAAVPLIVMLHGSGRDGRILLEHWQGVARKEGIALAGPDALDRQGWNVVPDGPHFIHDLVETVKKAHNIDPRRVYLFGHSAGAIHGLHLGILESEYFAAAAAHAGLVMSEFTDFIGRAPRKIPMAIWVGTTDRFFPLDAVRASRDALVAGGIPAQLMEIRGHTHDYYGRSSQINKDVWAFLQQHRLASDPKYQAYQIDR